MLPETNEDPVVGTLLDGRYQIVKLLGKGGMGNVYLADETRLRRRCALKVLHPRLADDRTHVERFLREAQTIAQFEHLNIVDIYSYGEEPSGVVFFAMELLTGEDLQARLRARGERPVSTHECCVWGIQIARAMAVVHDAGLIHRDLKASNIFLAQRRDGEQVVKLLDFGIARPEEGSELTTTGVSLGTPSYMSPEQVRNTAVDRRSDIYSFGVLLFKLLTNRLPFMGDAIQIAMAHCLTPPPTPSTVAPDAGISPELDAIVLQALAKDPADRPASMRAMEEALIAVLRAEAPELAPTARQGRTTVPPGAARSMGSSQSMSTTPPSLASLAAADPQTAPGEVQRTGPTAAMAAEVPGPPRRRPALALAAGVVGVLLILGVVWLRGGPDEAAPVVAAAPQAAAPAPTSPPVASAPPPPTPVPPPGEAEPKPVEPASQPTPGEPAAPKPAEPEPVKPEPAAPPTPRVAARPKPEPRAEPRPVDPLTQVQRRAQQCRRAKQAVDGPKITIDYAVGIDGKVTRSIPSVADALGKCLAAAVQNTQFEPKLVLGKKLSL